MKPFPKLSFLENTKANIFRIITFLVIYKEAIYLILENNIQHVYHFQRLVAGCTYKLLLKKLILFQQITFRQVIFIFNSLVS